MRLLALLWLVSAAHGAEFRVSGVRGATIYAERQAPAAQTVGALTDRLLRGALSRRQIREYQGSEGAVLSIERLRSATEEVSATEYRAYGWCYRVDGFEPAVMANQFRLTGRERLIEWWYAYAHYKDGRWLAMCEAADHDPNL